MEQSSFDKIFKEFYNNIDKKELSQVPSRCHCVYYLKTEDLDGNIVQENYGINLVPDIGFVTLLRGQGITRSNCRLMLGGLVSFGEDTYDPYVDDNLISALQTIESSMSQAGGCKYDSVSGYLYRTYDGGKAVFDYDQKCPGSKEVPGSDIRTSTISIIGNADTRASVGYNKECFLSVSKIYNMQGEEVELVKEQHQKVTVYYYFTSAFKPGVLLPALINKNLYACIDPISFNFGHNAQLFPKGVVGFITGYRNCIEVVYNQSYNDIFKPYVITEKNYDMNPYYTSQYLDRFPDLNNHSITSRGLTSYEIELYYKAFEYGDTETYQILPQFVHDFQNDSKYRPINCSVWLTGYSIGSSLRNTTSMTSEFVVMEKEFLSSPDTLTLFNAHTTVYLSDELHYNFAIRNSNIVEHNFLLPVYNFDITELKMFNIKTGLWDIDVPNNNDTVKNNDYSELSNMTGRVYIEGPLSNGVYFGPRYITVFINDKTDVPIKSFDTVNKTIYATDSYWDTTTWSQIPDPSNISQSLRNKRYYLFVGISVVPDDKNLNSNFIPYPNRDRTNHKLTLTKTIHDMPVKWNACTYRQDYSWSSYASSRFRFPVGTTAYDNHWFYINGQLFYNDPNGDESQISSWKKFDITGYNNSIPLDGLVINFDNDILMVPGLYDYNATASDISDIKKHVRFYYDLADLSNTTTLSYCDIELDLDPDIDYSNKSHFEILYDSTDTGYVIAHFMDLTTPSTVAFNIADLDTTNITLTQIHLPSNAYMVQCIKLTNYVVFAKNTNTSLFSIYDLENETFVVEDAFEIPEGYTVLGVRGWKQNVYVAGVNSNNIFAIWRYDISSSAFFQMNEYNYASNNIPNQFITASDFINTNKNRPNQFDLFSYADENVFVLSTHSVFKFETSTTSSYADKKLSGVIYFTSDEPDVLHEMYDSFLYTNNGSYAFECCTYGKVSLINDGKQLIMPLVVVNSNAIMPQAIDVGRLYKNKEQLLVSWRIDSTSTSDSNENNIPREGYIFSYTRGYTYRTNSYNGFTFKKPKSSSFYYYSTAVVWGNGLLIFYGDTISDINDTSATNTIQWVPLEHLIPMKMTGTTTTIQSFDIPKRLSNKNFNITLSNNQ